MIIQTQYILLHESFLSKTNQGSEENDILFCVFLHNLNKVEENQDILFFVVAFTHKTHHIPYESRHARSDHNRIG